MAYVGTSADVWISRAKSVFETGERVATNGEQEAERAFVGVVEERESIPRSLVGKFALPGHNALPGCYGWAAAPRS